MNLFDGTDLLETTSTEIKNRILKPGQMLRAIDTGALYYGDKDGKPTAFVGTSTNSSGGLGSLSAGSQLFRDSADWTVWNPPPQPSFRDGQTGRSSTA